MLPGEGGHAWRCAHMKLTSALPWKPAECFRVLSSKAADDIFGVFGNGGCVGGDALIIKYAAVSAKKSPSKPQSASVHVEKYFLGAANAGVSAAAGAIAAAGAGAAAPSPSVTGSSAAAGSVSVAGSSGGTSSLLRCLLVVADPFGVGLGFAGERDGVLEGVFDGVFDGVLEGVGRVGAGERDGRDAGGIATYSKPTGLGPRSRRYNSNK